jgi:FAD binding domain
VPAAIHTPVLIVGAASPGCPTATTARSGGGWGIDLEGARAADGHHTAVVEADLNLALRGRRVSIAYLQQPRPFTTLMAHDDQGRRWSSDAGSDPRRASPEDFSDDRVAELGRTAGGLPGLAVRLRPQVPGTDLEVLASHRRPPRRQRSPAGCCRLGRRACLAADRGPGRQHRHPDAHSLAWRLAAAVVKGTAGAGLLDTYDRERRSIGRLTTGQGWAWAAASLQVPVHAVHVGVDLTPAGAAAHGSGAGEPCWSGPTAWSPGPASAPPDHHRAQGSAAL